MSLPMDSSMPLLYVGQMIIYTHLSVCFLKSLLLAYKQGFRLLVDKSCACKGLV
jgi:hypothetical protein